MLITIRFIIYLLIHITFILGISFILLYKKMSKPKKLTLLFIVTGIYILIIVFPLFDRTNQVDFFDKVQMNHENSLENLTIKELNGRLVLFDQNNNEKIEDNIKYRFPVYLMSFEKYYLIIYSHNQKADYSNGYFKQGDYEMDRKTDKIIILSKVSPHFIEPRVYDIIGKVVDLNKVKASNDTIGLPILIPHEDRIGFIYSVYINPKFYQSDNFFRCTTNYVAFKYSLNDPNIYLVDYLIYDDYTMITLDSYNNIMLHSYKITYHNNGSSSYINEEDLLKEQNFVKKGYITLANDKFYYLGNDKKLYYLDFTQSVYVTDVVDLDNWLSYIPS